MIPTTTSGHVSTFTHAHIHTLRVLTHKTHTLCTHRHMCIYHTHIDSHAHHIHSHIQSHNTHRYTYTYAHTLTHTTHTPTMKANPSSFQRFWHTEKGDILQSVKNVQCSDTALCNIAMVYK